jgi:hypothetical protein
MSSRTVPVQSPGVPARSPLPTVANASAVDSNRSSRASTCAPASSSSRAPAALPWYAAACRGCSPKRRVRGEAQLQHEGERLGRAGLGGLTEHGPVVVGQSVHQVRVIGEQLPGRMTVGAQARAQKPVGLGAVVSGAERAQACCSLPPARPYRQAQR